MNLPRFVAATTASPNISATSSLRGINNVVRLARAEKRLALSSHRRESSRDITVHESPVISSSGPDVRLVPYGGITSITSRDSSFRRVLIKFRVRTYFASTRIYLI